MRKKSKKEGIQKEIDRLRLELMTIEENEASEKSAKLYRRCFRYRNSFSCPKGPEDYWWLYCKVLVVEGSIVTCMSFQVDKYGDHTYEPKKERHYQSGIFQAEISEKEFNLAFEQFRKGIRNA